jgi:hypothetical protein
MLLCYILDIYLSFLFVCTESLTLVSNPTGFYLVSLRFCTEDLLPVIDLDMYLLEVC